MASLIISLIGLAVLGFLFFKRKPSQNFAFTAQTRWLFWAGLLVMGLYAAFWLALGASEAGVSMAAGLAHGVPGAVALAMIWLARKLPLESGLILGFQGLAQAVYTLAMASGPLSFRLTSALFTGGAPILASLLVLWACALALEQSKSKPRP